MNSRYILQSDILDIIFENKNKEYGAYTLRKFYPQRLYKAVGIILILCATFALIVLLQKKNIVAAVADFDWNYSIPVLPDEAIIPVKPVVKNPIIRKLSVLPSAIQKPLINSGAGRIVISTTGDKIDKPDFSGTPQGSPGLHTSDSNNNFRSVSATSTAAPVDKMIPVVADIMPSYPGGIKALQHFLSKNLVTPKNMEEGETVSVKIKFIVGYDGVLKGFEVTEDGGELFNNEVVRVLKKMPAWIPGKASGENVSVFYSIPVKFTSAD